MVAIPLGADSGTKILNKTIIIVSKKPTPEKITPQTETILIGATDVDTKALIA